MKFPVSNENLRPPPSPTAPPLIRPHVMLSKIIQFGELVRGVTADPLRDLVLTVNDVTLALHKEIRNFFNR